MNEIREVAKAYYNGAARAEKKMAKKFFKTLDKNRDRKVSLAEFKKKLEPSFSNDEMFGLLDENGDGTLDFDEALALYYMNKVSIPKCSACNHVLLTSYFSCLPCEGKTSYRLCCNCYSRRKFDHHHPSHEFFDSRALLNLLEELLAKANVTLAPRDILHQESFAQKVEATVLTTAEIGTGLADAMGAVEGLVELGAVLSSCCIM